MFFLNIIAALVLIGFIVFVFFKNNNSISLDFTNFQKKIRIKKRNYLSNVFYKHNNEYKYSFLKIMDVLDIDGKPTNGSNNINCLVLDNTQKEPVNITIPYNNIIGKIYNPIIFKELSILINKLKTKNNDVLNISLVKPIIVNLTYKNDTVSQTLSIVNISNKDKEQKIEVATSHKKTFELKQIILEKKKLYIFNGVDKIEVNQIDKISNQTLKDFIKNKVDITYIYVNKDSNKTITLNNKDVFLLCSFYYFLDDLSDVEKCQLISDFCFIDITTLSGKNKEIALKYLNVINMINTHIEIFTLFKFVTSGQQKTSKFLIHDYLCSIFPSANISMVSFDCAYTLLNINTVFDLNKYRKEEYIDSYFLDFVLDNIAEKYSQNEKDKIWNVIQTVDNTDNMLTQYIQKKLNIDNKMKISSLLSKLK
jgi:hypothetical protein